LCLAAVEPLARAPLPQTGAYLAASDLSVLWACAVLIVLLYWLSVYAASVWRVIDVGTTTNRQLLKLD
jgi:hypothetical protein